MATNSTSMAARAARGAVQRRGFVLLAAAAILLFGAFQIDDVEVDVLPEFLPTTVEVQTEALGLSATEVEQLITVPLEADLLNGVAFLENIHSQSMPGLSSIVMTFESGTDLFHARQLVQERLTQAAGLPNVSRAPSMVQPLSSESRVMMVGLSSEDVSLIDMSVLARWTIRPRLMGVDGVANVSVWGQRERQLQVNVDPADLAASGVTLLDVVKTAGNAMWVSPLSYLEASTPGSGGFIDGPNQRIGVQHELSISNPEDLAGVAVAERDDVALGDVAQVVEDHQPLIGDAIVDDGPGLLLVVEKFPWSNTRETTASVEAALAELAPGLTGVTVDTDLFRPANYIDQSIDNVQLSLLVGMVLLAGVLFAVFLDWRAAVTMVLTLLVTMAGAVVVLLVTDTTVNFMVIAGLLLALFIVVEDVVTATYTNRMATASVDGDADPAEVTGAAITRRSGVFALVAIGILAVPVFVMEGTAGEFLPPVVSTMLLVFAVSVVAIMVLTPALQHTVGRLGTPGPEADSIVVRTVRGPFDRTMTAAVGRPAVAAVMVGVLLAVGAVAVPTIDRGFVPDFEQTDLLVAIDAVPGTSLQETRRVAGLAAVELRSLDGVEEVGVHVGRAVLSDEIVNVNAGELWMNLADDADYTGTRRAIRAVVEGYPGLGTSQVLSYANDRVDAVLSSGTDELLVRVFGENPEILVEATDQVAGLTAGVDGVDSVVIRAPRMKAGIQIEVDLDRSAAFQLKPGDVRRAAATLLSGIEVGSFFEDQKVFEVVVWSPPEVRSDLTKVEEMLIDTPSGEVVPLAAVADVTVEPGPTVIERDAVSRYIDVVVETSGRSREGVGDGIRAAIADAGLPFEYHAQVIDTGDEDADNRDLAILVSLAALVTAFLVLQAALRSWRLAALVSLAAPAAIAGAVIVVLVRGDEFSIGVAAAFFGVAAITLRLALSLLTRYETMQLDDARDLDRTLVVSGASDRFAPVMATLLAIAVVALPLALLGDNAGHEIVRPMSFALLGGLVTSAIVVLFLLPALYGSAARPALARDPLFGDPHGGPTT